MKKNSGLVHFLLLFVLAITLFGSIVIFYFAKNNKNFSPDNVPEAPSTSESKDLISVTGVIRYAGLMDEEKGVLGLSGDYQVTQISLPSKEEAVFSGYYLETESPMDIKSNLGKCVRVEGEILKGWENLEGNNFEVNDKWAYNRSALILEKMEVLELGNCSPYAFKDRGFSDDEVFESAEFKGVIKHSVRPAPDIGYDYELHLLEPYIDNRNASGMVLEVDVIVISPSSNQLWEQFETNMGEGVSIEGVWYWGYAESRYVEVNVVELL